MKRISQRRPTSHTCARPRALLLACVCALAPSVATRRAHAQHSDRSAPIAAPAVQTPEAQPESVPPQAEAATPEAEEPTFEAVAEVQAPPREATKHTLTQAELTTIPGTRGDALRAVEVMPGVARTQFAASEGAPLLRGSAASESLVMLDGVSMPLLYHFGGLTSFFNSHLLESVTLYPGNYSTRYGRAAAGLIEAKVRDPGPVPHVMLELSTLDSFVLAEAPLTELTSIAVAARRSNVDLFFDALVSDDSTTVIAAPVYWDYQAILAHRFNDAHKFRFFAYGGSDAFELHFGEALAEDPALQGEFGTRIALHRLQLELDSRLSERVEQKLVFALGPQPGRGKIGELAYDFTSWDAAARADWSFSLARWLRLDGGLDAQALHVTVRYSGPPPPTSEGVPPQGALAADSKVELDTSYDWLRAAAYVEASITPTEAVLVVPGVRVDHFVDLGDVTVDPRLTSRVAVGPSTTLKAGAGSFSQPPQYWESIAPFGNPDAKPFRTLQTSAGVEQALGERALLDLDAFYKHWLDRIVDTPGGAPPRYVNGGSADAYGVGLLLDARPLERLHAYVSYTLSRSTRDDGDGTTRLFDDDQTHNASVALSLKLGSGWQLGSRFRYVTGNPYSAVEGAVYDASSDTYRPLYGELNAVRHTDFHQLDLRVDKTWQLGPLSFTAYLEIMNVYNQPNTEALRYSFDYSESSKVLGMPFFPNLGLRGEL